MHEGRCFPDKALLSSPDPIGKDEASSVEVTWPDGKMASRRVASEEMNSVLEIPYPSEEDRVQDPAPLEVSRVVQGLKDRAASRPSPP